MASIRQTSFAAGELAPQLWGRTDLTLFPHGARTLRNFIISRQGNAVSRPGTKYHVKAKTSNVVLVPFIYSDSVSYLFELGEGYLRIHDPKTPTFAFSGVELSTPWSAGDLVNLQYVQSGGSMFFTCAGYDAKELLAPSVVLATWLLRDMRFTPPGSTPATVQSVTPSFTQSTESGGHIVLGPLLVSAPSLTTLFVGDASHPPREWQWKVSSLMQNNTTGQIIETLPLDVTQYWDGTPSSASVSSLPANNLVVLYADRAVVLRYPSFGPLIGTLALDPNWTPIGQAYYRGRGNLFGFVGTTSSAQDFVDVGEEPNYLLPPLRGETPFPSTGTGLARVTERPAAVAFFQQRLVFGGTNTRPTTIMTSAVNAWANFDAPRVPKLFSGCPLVLTLASRRRECVRSMIASQRLLIFTDSSVWSMGGENGPFDYNNIGFRLEDSIGSSTLQPLIIEGSVLFVRSKGRSVRALTAGSSGNGGYYDGQDITWHAEHLFRGASTQIVSWARALDPWGVIWAVRGDGVLISGTNTISPNDDQRQQSYGNLWAWSSHTTGSGADFVYSVTSVPDTDADAVFIAVQRVNGTYIERLTTRDRITTVPINATSGDGTYALDAQVGLLGTAGANITVNGLSHLEGRQVWAVAPGNSPLGPYTVVGGAVTVGPLPNANLADGVTVLGAVGLPFVCDLETLDAAPGDLGQKTTVRVGIEVDSAQGLQVGEDFDHLAPWQQRNVTDGYLFPSAATALVTVDVKGSYRKTARAALRQSLPQPVTVLGITREVSGGG